MSDFIAWLCTAPIPSATYGRWRWAMTNIGYRQRPWMPLATHRSGRALTIIIGGPGGRRPRGRSVPAPQLAAAIHSDILASGSAALDRFIGPVAGLHIDLAQGTTTIWRDRFGRIPIQIVSAPTGLVITTCPQAADTLAGPEIEPTHLANFLHHDRHTDDGEALANLRRLRPSEVIVVDGERRICSRRTWWRPRAKAIDADAAVAAMRQRLETLGEALKGRPHLLALSAGLDSAALGAVATSRHPGGQAITFADRRSAGNEADGARAVAEHLGLGWAPFSITDHGPLSRLSDHHFPTAWGPCGHPDLAWKRPFYRWLGHRHPGRAIVYGNGADDALWVPPALWLSDRWRDLDLRALSQAFGHLSMSQWLRPGLTAAVDRWGLRSWRHRLPSWPTNRQPWQHPDAWVPRADQDPTPPMAGPPDERFFDLRTWRLSTWRWERAMRCLAWEARIGQRPILTPFLDAPFWELSLSLSPDQLVEGGRQKAVLRRAVADLLPEDCMQRPKTGGFDAVVERGLADRASRQVYALFARPLMADAIGLRPASFLAAFEAYRRAPGVNRGAPCRGSWAIWKSVGAELWLRQQCPRSDIVL